VLQHPVDRQIEALVLGEQQSLLGANLGESHGHELLQEVGVDFELAVVGLSGLLL